MLDMKIINQLIKNEWNYEMIKNKISETRWIKIRPLLIKTKKLEEMPKEDD